MTRTILVALFLLATPAHAASSWTAKVCSVKFRPYSSADITLVKIAGLFIPQHHGDFGHLVVRFAVGGSTCTNYPAQVEVHVCSTGATRTAHCAPDFVHSDQEIHSLFGQLAAAARSSQPMVLNADDQLRATDIVFVAP